MGMFFASLRFVTRYWNFPRTILINFRTLAVRIKLALMTYFPFFVGYHADYSVVSQLRSFENPGKLAKNGGSWCGVALWFEFLLFALEGWL